MKSCAASDGRASPLRTRLSLSAAAFLAAASPTGCRTPPSTAAANLERYQAALERTSPLSPGALQPGSAEEQAARERFVEFYRDFSADAIRAGLRAVYAEHAFLADPFKSLDGLDQIEDYLLRSTETFLSCQFDITDFAGREGEYYARWLMRLTLKRAPDDPIEVIGMTHLRFDASGKVIFHQDYWDAGVVYERLPLLGRMVRTVRARL